MWQEENRYASPWLPCARRLPPTEPPPRGERQRR
uniref:Uncharacterized protein n=1 Tax=Setaria viridis TaxID=4556 RepID=A0A4U6TG31_SETVI|nr:hypothetical protein SEVIR_8G062250v2 [Setaria viridis]